jgi:hypothetical protein
MLFKGLASQSYDSGEKNRNGYKIDPSGWTFKNYKNNPIILLQHNAEDGGIGKALSFEVTDAGLNILFYVDLNTLEEKSAYQVKNGYISAISTGHITLDDAIEENDSGDRYKIEDAIEKFGWDNIWRALCGMSDLYTYVVTKAEAIENSLVTIGSNEKAIAMPNAIGKFAQTKYSPLLNKFEEMKKAQENAVVTNDEEVVETPATEEVAEETETTVEETTEAVSEAVEADSEANKKNEDCDEDEEVVSEMKDDEEEKKNDAEDVVADEVAADETTETETPAETAETQPETVEETTDTSSETPAAATENAFSAVEFNSLKQENAKLAEDNAVKDKLLEDAIVTINGLAKTIESQDKMIAAAKNFVMPLGKGFDATSSNEAPKTELEKRMKKTYA